MSALRVADVASIVLGLFGLIVAAFAGQIAGRLPSTRKASAHEESARTASARKASAGEQDASEESGRHEGGADTPPPVTNPAGNTALVVATQPIGSDFQAGRELEVVTWSVSPERDVYISRRPRAYLSAAGGALLVFASALLLAAYADETKSTSTNEWRTLGVAEAVVGVFMCAYAVMPYAAARTAYRTRSAATAAALVNKALDDACASDTPLALPDVFRLNRRQLDEYQLITRKQQRSAFLWAQVASIFAFLVLVAGIAAALSGRSNVDKYVAGGLSGLGALLSGFLANTFFASAKDANAQMNRYYLEPQRTGRLLAIERTIGQISTPAEMALLTEIVTAVLGWGMPDDGANPAPAGAAGQPREAAGQPIAPAGQAAGG
jgi:hypothetical protein